jgi:ferric-dicitrate binding protein FerR (iron transport regulator)
MEPDRIDTLIDRHLDGLLADADGEELAGLLVDADARRRFAIAVDSHLGLLDRLGRASQGTWTPRVAGPAHTQRRPAARWTAIAAAAMLVLITGFALMHGRSATESLAVISEMIGKVTVEHARATDVAIIGRSLIADDLLTVDQTGSVRLLFRDGTTVELAAGATLRLHSAKHSLLERGEITVAAAKQRQAALVFETAHAIAEIVGTSFHLIAGPSATRLAVDEGSVAFERLRDHSRIGVQAGRSAIADDSATLAFASWPTPRWTTWHGEQKSTWVNALAFSPDGSILAAALHSGYAALIDVASGTEIRRLTGHSDAVHDLAFAPDGRSVATASVDCTARLWDIAGTAPPLILAGHAKEAFCVVFSPDGRQVACGSYDQQVRAWDTATGIATTTMSAHDSNVFDLVFTPAGDTLISCSWDQTIKLWDWPSGTERRVLRGHTAPVFRLALAPDGKLLASVGWEREPTVRLWSLPDGAPVRSIPVPSLPDSIAISPDGELVALGGMDNTVRIFALTTGVSVVSLTGHRQPVRSLAFSPSGSHLASGDREGVVRLWRSDEFSGSTDR